MNIWRPTFIKTPNAFYVFLFHSMRPVVVAEYVQDSFFKELLKVDC